METAIPNLSFTRFFNRNHEMPSSTNEVSINDEEETRALGDDS